MRFLVAASAVLALAAPSPAEATFRSSISSIDAAYRARIVGSSWHAGCPVPLRKLRLLRVSHHGFDGRAHVGRLVVHRNQAHKMVRVLRRLYAVRFPIRGMRLVDAYGGSDNRSMAADNTSAFNCRRVEGSTSWSQHAYGRAIDINPVENPYVKGGRVSPPAGAPYADRSRRVRGMIRPGGAVVRAFASVGWGWGGYWVSLKDYQHFSANGR